MDIQLDYPRFAVDTAEDLHEDIKEFKVMLEKLKNGEVSDDEFRSFRLKRGIYGQRIDQPGLNMIRVKIPGGILASEQLRTIGYVAAEYADGLGHVTTRQDIQYHWVKIETVPQVMKKLAETGLTTREACGNTVRNVVGSPVAGVSREEAFDITPYLLTLTKYLMRNEITSKLPRKFKISFSGADADRDGIIPWIHDIGFVATTIGENGSERRGFKVYIGGGLGAHTRVADVFEEFLPVEQFIQVSAAIISVFDKHGDHINRKRARMKYVLWKLGFQDFKKHVYKERDRLFPKGTEVPEVELYDEEPPEYNVTEKPDVSNIAQHEFDFWRQTNISHQKQKGYNIVYVNPVIGDITSEQYYALAKISETYSDGTVRTSATQDIILRWIKTDDLMHLYSDLKKAGLETPGADSIGNVTACPGADTCQLGITHSRALGSELTTFFRENSGWSKILRDLRVKISGCPNSCGQHHVASIGLHGAVRKVKGRLAPHYILFIGGGINSGLQDYGDIVMKIPAKRGSEAVMRIVKRFLSERNEEETFWDYVKRVGPRSFKEHLQDLALVPSYEEAPEYYTDIGEDTDFIVNTGPGECMS